MKLGEKEGVVDALLSLLKTDDNPQVHHLCLGALKNIAIPSSNKSFLFNKGSSSPPSSPLSIIFIISLLIYFIFNKNNLYFKLFNFKDDLIIFIDFFELIININGEKGTIETVSELIGKANNAHIFFNSVLLLKIILNSKEGFLLFFFF